MPIIGTHTNGDGITFDVYESNQKFLSGGHGFPSHMCPPSWNRSELPAVPPAPMRDGSEHQGCLIKPRALGKARKRTSA